LCTQAASAHLSLFVAATFNSPFACAEPLLLLLHDLLPRQTMLGAGGLGANDVVAVASATEFVLSHAADLFADPAVCPVSVPPTRRALAAAFGLCDALVEVWFPLGHASQAALRPALAAIDSVLARLQGRVLPDELPPELHARAAPIQSILRELRAGLAVVLG
jgi:hypothetical protein